MGEEERGEGGERRREKGKLLISSSSQSSRIPNKFLAVCNGRMPFFYPVDLITYTKLEHSACTFPIPSQHLRLTREAPTGRDVNKNTSWRTCTFATAQRCQRTICLGRSSRRRMSPRHLDTLSPSWILVDPRGSFARLLARLPLASLAPFSCVFRRVAVPAPTSSGFSATLVLPTGRGSHQSAASRRVS